MKKRIIFAGIDPLNGNRGVGALAYSTIYILNKISKEYNVDLDIQILGSSNRKEELILNINGEEIVIRCIPFDGGKGLKNFLKFCFSMIFSFRDVINANYVLDIGLGDSFSDIYGKGRFNMINFPKRLFRLLGKKQLLLPQTIGPFNDPKISKEARRSIEACNVVFARDKMSYDYVIDNTSQRNIKELIDVAFFMPYKKKVFGGDEINVGLNISSLMWHGGYTKNNQFGFVFDYQKMMRKVIDYFLSVPNVKLHLIPHVVAASSHIENDYEISRIIQDEYSSPKMVLSHFFLDPIEAKNYISGLDFFLGARMHACIAAFSSKVPVYPIAYSRKFNGLFVETLDYPYIGDLINQSENEFLDGMKLAFNDRSKLGNKICERMEGIVTERGKILFEELKSFLELNGR